jgi:hypothetical protein
MPQQIAGCDSHAKDLGVAIVFLIDAHTGIAAVRCAQVEISNP